MKQGEFDKIEHYIEGVADDSEKQFAESLFLKGENNLYFRQLLEKDWDLVSGDNTTSEDNHLQHILDRVHHIIRKNETLERRKFVQRFIQIYMRAAAILILPLLISGGLVYRYFEHNDKMTIGKPVNSTIYAPMGARVSFNLPDGTTGMLNSGSHLTYSLPFENNRKIKLEGEAWFDVNHDEDHPFEITVGNSMVRVMGTSFNLSAYPLENYIEVVLKQGKVEFLDYKSDKKVALLASERLIFQNGNINKSITDPAKYNAWTEGKLVFRGDPMTEVARRIERWYNVKVELADPGLSKYSFRATFEDDQLQDVLRFLSMTSPIRYEITPRELLSDNTYRKEKVTIYLKK